MNRENWTYQTLKRYFKMPVVSIVLSALVEERFLMVLDLLVNMKNKIQL